MGTSDVDFRAGLLHRLGHALAVKQAVESESAPAAHPDSLPLQMYGQDEPQFVAEELHPLYPRADAIPLRVRAPVCGMSSPLYTMCSWPRLRETVSHTHLAATRCRRGHLLVGF